MWTTSSSGTCSVGRNSVHWRVLALSAVLTLTPPITLAESIEGRVVAVADGDTLTLLDATKTQHKIRLQGIDAPEKGQPFGQRSKQNLSGLVHGKPVRAECTKRDRYGRQVCTVWVLNQDAGLAQITQGLAWHYKRYENEQPAEERVRYADAEAEAREKRLGLWGDKATVAPWESGAQNDGGCSQSTMPICSHNQSRGVALHCIH